jgi:hypothetical protein
LLTIIDAHAALCASYERGDFVFSQENGKKNRSQVLAKNFLILVLAIIILTKVDLQEVDIYI